MLRTTVFVAAKTKYGVWGLGDNMKSFVAVFATSMVFNLTSAQAQDALSKMQAEFIFGGEKLNIQTGFEGASIYAARFAGLAPACNPECIARNRTVTVVETLSEPDVFEFLASSVSLSEEAMVDARMPDGRALGYIPGSVNLPAQTVSPDNEFRDDILEALGARAFEGMFNFTDAQSLVVYDNGPTQNDADKLIRHLLDAGHPSGKISVLPWRNAGVVRPWSYNSGITH